MRTIYITVGVLLLLTGCSPVTAMPKPEPGTPYKEWPQRCELCGSEWLITPVEHPDEVVPPTVPWCFNDGHYCDAGIRLILEAAERGDSDDRSRVWLNHCLSCQGCRCASFKPAEWQKIVDTIQRVRADQE